MPGPPKAVTKTTGTAGRCVRKKDRRLRPSLPGSGSPAEYRDGRAAPRQGPDACDDGLAGHVGQPEIGEHEVERLRPGELERRASGARVDHRRPFGLEPPPEELPQEVDVLDDEQPYP